MIKRNSLAKKLITLILSASMLLSVMPTNFSSALSAQDDITGKLFNNVADKSYIKLWGPTNTGTAQTPVWASPLVEIPEASLSTYFNLKTGVTDFYNALFGANRQIQPRFNPAATPNLLFDVGLDLKAQRTLTGLDVGGDTKTQYPTAEVYYSTAETMPGTDLANWTLASVSSYASTGKITFTNDVQARHVRFHPTSSMASNLWKNFNIWKVLGPNSQFTGTYDSLEVVTPPTKTSYVAGFESFNNAGMTVLARYSDGTATVASGYTVTPSGAIPSGTTSVTVSHTISGTTYTTTQAITAVDKTATSLVITKKPNKTLYSPGENFVKTGMTATIYFDDSTSFNLVDSQLTAVADSLTEGVTAVTVTVDTIVAIQPIAVVDFNNRTLMKIAVTQYPNKMHYIVGELFNTNGLVVTGTLDNGIQINILDFTVSKTTALATTDETSGLTLTYLGKETKVYPYVRTAADITATVYPDQAAADARIKAFGPPKTTVWATDGSLEAKVFNSTNFWYSVPNSAWSLFSGSPKKLQPAFTDATYGLRKWDLAFDLGTDYIVNSMTPAYNKTHYPTFEIWYSTAATMPGANLSDGWTKATNAVSPGVSNLITFDAVKARHIRFHPLSTTTANNQGTWGGVAITGYNAVAVPPLVDLYDLQRAIAVATAKSSSLYTAASYANLTTKLTAANAMLGYSPQATIDTATNELNAAIDALVEFKPVLVSVGKTNISVLTNTNSSVFEYSINGTTFSSSTAFTGLTPNTAYTITVREIGTSTIKTVSVKTLSSYAVTLGSSQNGTSSGGSSLTNLDYNASVTVLATPNSGYKFLNWTIGSEVVSTTAAYTFRVKGNTTITPNFVANSDISVTFMDINGEIVRVVSGIVSGTDSSVVVNGYVPPVKYGYTFANWESSPNIAFTGNVTSSMIVTAKYTNLNVGSTITVIAGASNTSFAATYDSLITVAAPSAPIGKQFSHWTQNGKIVSYDAALNVRALNSNMTFTAVFVDVGVGERGNSVIIQAVSNDAGIYKVFGQTLVNQLPTEVGILISSLNNFDLNTSTNTSKTVLDKVTTSGQFVVAVDLTGLPVGKTAYARVYTTYKDANNNLVTVYSDITVLLAK
jgi:hypothetical protein